MTAPISRTATLLDECQRLATPEEYVRKVLSNMVPLQRKHDGVVVRIGITGTGAFPNYRIDLPSDPPSPIAAYDGQTHGPFKDVRNIDTQNWSQGSLNYEAVRSLLGMIRASRTKR